MIFLKIFLHQNKNRIAFIILLSCLFININGFAANKYASLIIEEHSGKILYSRSANEKRYPASMTKVMTIYILFQELEKGTIKLNSKIKVSSRAAGQPPSKLGLKKGEIIDVKTAMLALVTKSANDVATAISEKISGTEVKFAQRMSKTAKKLGMKSTKFMNASGLHNRHQRSTAYDMAKLASAIRRDFPQYYKIFNTRKFSWKGRTFKNHNKLLDSYAGTDGIKTGYVDASGFNLMASVERNGVRLIGIVFGGKSGKSRDLHLMGLFNKTFPKAKKPNIIMVKAPIKRPKNIPIEIPVLKHSIPRNIILTSIPVSKPNLLLNKTKNHNLISNQKDWGIQIGTYSKKANAHRMALQTRRVASDILQMLPAELAPIYIEGTTAWRVRFNQLTEISARDICSKLLLINMSCVPVPSETILGYVVKKTN